MIAILIAFISIIGFFLLYLINPRDVFKVRRVIQNKISKKTSIDRDSEKIIEIFKDQPPEAKPWHIEMLVDRFKDISNSAWSPDGKFITFLAKKEEKNEDEMVLCPVGRFFLDLEKASGKKSKFFEHLIRSRVEFLKAIRSLVDERIEGLEKKGSTKGSKKMTKIKVE